MEKFQLIKGRHSCPTEKFIFKRIANVHDYSWIYQKCYRRLAPHKNSTIAVYVSGLVIATVVVMEVCRELNIDLVLYFYNKRNGDFIPYVVNNDTNKRY